MCKIRGSHRSVAEDLCFLGRDALSPGASSLHNVRRNSFKIDTVAQIRILESFWHHLGGSVPFLLVSPWRVSTFRFGVTLEGQYLSFWRHLGGSVPFLLTSPWRVSTFPFDVTLEGQYLQIIFLTVSLTLPQGESLFVGLESKNPVWQCIFRKPACHRCCTCLTTWPTFHTKYKMSPCSSFTT